MVTSLDMLSPAVKRKMEDIFQNDRSIFSDTRISQMLMEFPEDMAMAALNEFSCAEHDPSNVIRSRPAYLMGVLRKYRSGDRPRSNVGKRRGGGSGRGGGGDNYRHDRDYSPAGRGGDYHPDRRDGHSSGPQPSYGYAPSVSQRPQQPAYNTSQGTPPPQQQPQQQQYSSNPNYGYGGAGEQSPNYGGRQGGGGMQQQYSSTPQQQYQPAPQNRAETNPFGMSHRVRTRLEQMYGTGIVRREQIDARCVEFLSQMPDDLALQSLDEFSNNDSSNIRNHSAFLMSILRKNQTTANSPPSSYYASPQDNAPHDSRQRGPSGGGMRQRQTPYGSDSPPHGRAGGGAYGKSSYDAPVQQPPSSSAGYSGGRLRGGSFDAYPTSESASQSSYIPPQSYSSHQQGQPPSQQQQQPQYLPYDSQGGGPPPTQQGGGGGGYPSPQQHHLPQYGGGAPPLQHGDVPMMSNTSSYGGSGGGSYSSMPPDQGSHHQYSPPPKDQQQQQMVYYDSQQPQSQHHSGNDGGNYPAPQGGGYNQQHQGIPQRSSGRGEGGEYAPSSSYQQSLPPSHQGYGAGSPPMQHQQPPSHYVPPPGFEGISAAVVMRVERLFQTGFMRREEFDDRMVDQLKGVPEDEAVSAVDEFSTCDRKKIRKIGAYFNGVLRKHISRIRERQATMKSTANRSNKRRHSRSRSRSRDRFNPDRSGGGNREFERGGGPRGGRDIPPRGRDRDDNNSERMREDRGGSLPHEKRYRGNDGRGGPPPNNDFNSKKQNIPIQPPSLPSIRNVSDKVYFTLRALVAQGLINASEIDDRLGNALALMDEGQAILALDEFGACDLDRVRNRGGYLMGLVKRYRGDGSQGSSNFPRFNTGRGPVSPRSPQDTVERQQQDDVALATKAPFSTTTSEDHSTTSSTAGVSTALDSAVHMEGDTITTAVPPSSTTIALEEGSAVIEDRLGAPTSYNNPPPGAMPVSLPYTKDGKPAMTMNTADSSYSSSQPPTEVCHPDSLVGSATATPVAYDPEAFTMDVASLPTPTGALLVDQQPQQKQQVPTTAETEMMVTIRPPSFPTVPLAHDQVCGSMTEGTPLETQVQEQAKPAVVIPADTHVVEKTSGAVMAPVAVHVGEQALGTVVEPVVSQHVQNQVAGTGVIQAEVHVGEQTPGAIAVMPVETQVPLQVGSGTAFTPTDLDHGTTTTPVTNAPRHSGMEAHLSFSTNVDPAISKTGEGVVNIPNSASDPSAITNSASEPTAVPNIPGAVGAANVSCSETHSDETNRSAIDDGAATSSSLPNSTKADPMTKVTKEMAAVVTSSSETLEKGYDMMERFPSPI